MQIATRSGLRLAYNTRGKGPVIVLLHPVGLRGAFWQPVIDELADDFRLVAPDLRGHGASDVPTGDFTLADMARDVIDLIAAVGAPPVILCGCSLGGMLAQIVAIEAPEHVRGLVVAGAGYARNAESRQATLRRAEAARSGMPAIVETTLDRWFAQEVQLSDPVMVGTVRNWLLEDDPLVHARCWQAMSGLENTDALATIAAPTLAIAATGDQSVPAATLADLAARVPTAHYLEIPDAGHLAPLETPQHFARILGAFARDPRVRP